MASSHGFYDLAARPKSARFQSLLLQPVRIDRLLRRHSRQALHRWEPLRTISREPLLLRNLHICSELSIGTIQRSRLDDPQVLRLVGMKVLPNVGGASVAEVNSEWVAKNMLLGVRLEVTFSLSYCQAFLGNHDVNREGGTRNLLAG